MLDWTRILVAVLGGIVGAIIWAQIRKWWRQPISVVDEYTIALGPSEEFPTVHLSMKLNNGSVTGPYEFVPAFAHKLSDEMCIASARASQKVTGGEGKGVLTDGEGT